jgi:O-methyltransferase
MRVRRAVADFLIKGCGLRKLHNTRAVRMVRSLLDEIDVQHLRDVHPCRAFDGREQMYDFVHASFVNRSAIDYLEFGVFKGESIRHWVELNKDPNSRFYGFDSFEGLPEWWRAGQDKGHFDVGGNIPKIEDGRVQFVKGWFNQTVPFFVRSFVPKNRLVVHLDADLYGSTMLALLYLGPFMSPGTLLIFDEFYDREHEFKALMDWQKICKNDFRIVAQIENYGKVCAQLL